MCQYKLIKLEIPNKMSDDDYDYNVVIDNGSDTCLAGFCGDETASVFLPSMIGRERRKSDELDKTKIYIGSSAQNNPSRKTLSITYPIKNGIVTDWDGMEKIWHHIYNQLRVSPENHKVLITEAPLNPKTNKEKMIQVMMETFNVRGFSVEIPAKLAVYASGRITAIALDCGEGVSHVMPVYEGHPITSAIKRMDFAGEEITKYLQQLLYERGYTFTTSAEMEIVKHMKERMCYVTCCDGQKEGDKYANNGYIQTLYDLPDGQQITIGEEHYRCSEALFQPSLAGSNNGGIHELLKTSIHDCDLDVREDLYMNVLVSGRSTLLPGFADRLDMEMRSLLPSSRRLQIIAPPERAKSVWLGGSIIASLSSYQEQWISRAEYAEFGPNIVHRKCT